MQGDAADLLARDDQFLNLRGSVADLQPEHVIVALMVRKIGCIAVVAVQQQALVQDFARGLRHVPFAHRRLGRMRHAAVAKVQRIVTKLAHHRQLRFRLGKRESDSLIPGDGRAERLALLDVFPGLIHRRAGRPQALQPDQRAAVVETVHDGSEGAVLFGHQAFGGNKQIVEKHRAAADRAGADVVEMCAADALLAEIDEERADPARAAVGLSGAREHHGRVGLGGEAHGRLLAVQPPAVAGFLGTQAKIGRVRTAPRLCKPEPDDGFAGDDLRHPVPCDVLGGMARDHAAHQRPQKLDIAGVEVGISDLLGDQPRRNGAFAHPAQLLRKIGADEAKRTHLADEVAIEVMAARAGQIGGGEPLPGETAGAVTNIDLMIG